MSKINILSEIVCNRIAAGEVIERPFSVVKELVENSLDAGATEIEVYIEKGGKDLIKVVDNGCGIEKDDMRTAFISHATSKISEFEDIDKITTLGFRGEALASIASIAMVEMVSVTEGNPAFKVECDGEFIGKVQPAVLDKGTQISVRNLFFNTPVRFRFLKTDKKEESDITTCISKFILGNPEIAFRYYVDGKLALQSYGGGLEEAIAQVYGASVLPQCIKIYADRNDIVIKGFISNQNYFKPNKSYQTIFLNGRCIVNNVISTAISNAYSHYAMKRQYPFYTLFINVPLDMVDVNVHPNKSDVRFVNNSLVFGTIYKVVSSVLDGSAQALDFVADTKIVPEMKSTAVPTEFKNTIYGTSIQTEKTYDSSFDDVVGIEKYQKTPVKEEKKTDENKVDLSTYEDYPEPKYFSEAEYKIFNDLPEIPPLAVCCSSTNDLFEMGRIEERREYERKVKRHIDYVSCKYRGNLFNTYLLYEIKDEVFMIDQHAAHERLLYDKFIIDMRNRNIARQDMLYPYLLDFNPQESAFFEERLPLIRQLGFDIEPFGVNAFRVMEVPADFTNINLEKFFAEMMHDINSLKSITVEDLFKDKIAMMACKHAIKGGQELTAEERDKLFEMLNGDMGLKCPHGRPVCVKLTKKEIEKLFKRIV